MPEEHLSDFDDQPWCQEILKSGSIEIIPQPGRRPNNDEMRKIVSNTMMSQTLWTDQAIRAYVAFRRKTADGAVTYPYEYCLLLSLGDGCDGMVGRAHGGFNALVIDQLTGMCSEYAVTTDIPPATARLAMNYRAPIKTPGIVLARATVSKVEGRKVTVKATIEDGKGGVFADGEVLYIIARPKI